MRARTYDKEFKLNSIALVNAGKSVPVVSRELGIPETTLRDWVRVYAKNGENSFSNLANTGNVKDASKEDFNRIQRELNDVKIERDILKKALAIFSKQS